MFEFLGITFVVVCDVAEFVCVRVFLSMVFFGGVLLCDCVFWVVMCFYVVCCVFCVVLFGVCFVFLCVFVVSTKCVICVCGFFPL